MARVVERAQPDRRLELQTVQELRDYCYAVAGIVGEMLTELFLVDHPVLGPIAPRLRRRSRFFGEGLQLVNILKDAASDATEGRVYLPEGLDPAVVFARARHDLDHAATYVRALQRVGAPDGLVAFTGSPAILARASLDRIEAHGPGAKLTRPEVAALMERMFEDLANGREVIVPYPPLSP
jgi:farnesyl-diphosphate farnesyltransferase